MHPAPITNQTPLRDGERIRVKNNPYTRRYGVRCHSRLTPADDHLAPGEIGTVRRGSYKCHTGEMVGHWIVEFPRGRSVTLSCDADPAAETARWRVPSGYCATQLVAAIRHARTHPDDTYTPYVHGWFDRELTSTEYLAWFRRKLHAKISTLGAVASLGAWQTHVSRVAAKGYPSRAAAAGRQPGGPSSYMLLPAGTPLRLVGRVGGRIRESGIGVYEAPPCGGAGAACYLRLSAVDVRAVGPASAPTPRLSRVRQHPLGGRKLRADYQRGLRDDAARLQGYGDFGRRLETPEVRRRLRADHVHVYGPRVVVCTEASEQECA